MKRLTRECMDEYARNFYREKIRSGDDLVWYGRVETERHYKGDDPEVEAGKAKAGERKPGLQAACAYYRLPHGQIPDRVPFPAVQEQGKPAGS